MATTLRLCGLLAAVQLPPQALLRPEKREAFPGLSPGEIAQRFLQGVAKQSHEPRARPVKSHKGAFRGALHGRALERVAPTP